MQDSGPTVLPSEKFMAWVQDSELQVKIFVILGLRD